MKILLKILRKLKVLNYINIHVKITLNSTPFKIPILKGLGLGHLDMSEVWMIEIIRILNKVKEGAFIDIGVNTGQSLLKAKSINKDLCYLGFEPNPNCVNYVEELIRSNGFTNTTIIPSGISNKAEILELNFYQKSPSDSSASLDENLRPSKKIHYRKAVQVVDFPIIENIIPKEVAIIKIDVEGHELFVLQGIQKLIAQKRPILLLEVLPVSTEKNTARLERQNLIEIFFKDNSYKIIRIKKDSKENIKYLDSIEAIGNHPNHSDSDYIVVPAELEARFIQASADMGYKQNIDKVLV